MGLVPAGSQLTITSRLLPPLVVNLSGGPQPVGTTVTAVGSAAFLKLLAPSFTVTLAGQDLGTYSPVGQATKNYWPQIKIGLLVGGGLFLFWLIRKVL